ncbi:F-box domain containing protein [Trema orientale]|uniref:F-box domain containing protein n=1 Tax=Trema orientale TaxID=63057 RepID=A0A2P5BLH3_TREOI|nr:F-box domain containing protein [Trema orientale]
MEGCLKAGAKSLKFAIRNCQQAPKAKRLCPNSKDAEINRFVPLPEEIEEEILLRLPADSLNKCKRVCKWWFDLINDPSFINKHLLRATIENRKPPSSSSSSSFSFFLKWIIPQELSGEDNYNPYGNDLSKLVLSLVTVCEDNDGNDGYLPCVIEQVNLPPIPVIEGEDFPTNFSVFHCNGIIHMFDNVKNWTSILLNPALREFKLVREPDLPLPPKYEDVMGCGFGYDPKANLYKYVKVFGDYLFEDPVAMVHTLGTNSWRKIKIDVEEDDDCFLQPGGVYCKGAYHWLKTSRMGNTILSFDMSEEKFRSIPLPDHHSRRRSKNCLYILEVWKESVVLVNRTERSSFEMWVMVDNFGGIEGSTHWIKHLKIGPLARSDCPLAFWKDDELLFETKDGQVMSYNLYTKKLRKVPLSGGVRRGYTCATSCLSSLVSV